MALRVCSRYVSRFTVSPQLISIVFWGWFCFCLFCFVCVFGFLFVLFSVVVFASHVHRDLTGWIIVSQ